MSIFASPNMVRINSLIVGLGIFAAATATLVPLGINDERYFGLTGATGTPFDDQTNFQNGLLSGIWCTGDKRLDTIKVAFSDCDGKPMGTLVHAPWTPDPAPLLARLQRRIWHKPQPEPFYTFKRNEGIVEVGTRLCRGKDSRGEICQLRVLTNMGKTFLCGSEHNTDDEKVWTRASYTQDVLRHLSGFTVAGLKPGFTQLHIHAGPAVCRKK